MKKIIITQSNYIPWKGFFDSISAVDVFVVYDDMQYTKRDWRNRNLIKTQNGLKWLSIPVEVSGNYLQKIKDTKVADKNWFNSHWDAIKQNYKQSYHFKEMSDWIEPLYKNCKFEYLTDINMHFINSINNFFDIKTEVRYSSEFKLADEKTQKLVSICKDLHATDYFSGPAAKSYMDEAIFKAASINIHYWDYNNYPEYPQLNPPFEHSVSVLDLIFNSGLESKNYMKNI
jgi:hypothetical protein